MKINPTDLLNDLPGEELIRPGLVDFQAKCRTVESLLVAIASNRLRKFGILECTDADLPSDAELKLYGLLSEQHADAYTQYRAYTGRLNKFENALDHRVSRLSFSQPSKIHQSQSPTASPPKSSAFPFTPSFPRRNSMK